MTSIAPTKLAPDVELLGELTDTAFVEPQWLIRRGDRYVQVSELLYRVAEQLDGIRTSADIAANVTACTPWLVTAENVEHVLATKLMPLGLAVAPGAEHRTSAATPRSPLQLTGRVRMIAPATVDRIARVLQHLFAPRVALPALALLAAAHVWLYLAHGLTGALIEVLSRPALALLVLLVVLVSGVVHELGHAAALRYGGGRAGGMGFGFYLVYPAFYTDTSDAYRLGRWARVRVDLGGFYFQLLFGVGVLLLAVSSGAEFLLIAVLVINLELARQLLFPFVRFDGYWLLADLTGVRDFYSHLVPFVRSFLGRSGGPALPPLRRWAKAVFAVYAAAAVPVLAGLTYVFVTRAPEFVATAWRSIEMQVTTLEQAARGGDLLFVCLSALQALILVLPLVAAAFLLYSVSSVVVRTATAVANLRIGPAASPPGRA